MLERGFLIFSILLIFSSEFSYPGRVWTEFGTKFFFSFLAYLIQFWLKIMAERGFLIFWIFLLFFSEFSLQGQAWTEFGTKIFFLFLGLSHFVLAKNNSRKWFFNFLNYFTIFFPNFLTQVDYERNFLFQNDVFQFF